MSLLMMLVASGGALKAQTFTANANWPVPAGVTSLVSVSGKGAAGTPAGDSEYIDRYRVTTTGYKYYSISGDTVMTGQSTSGIIDGPAPRDSYCTAATITSDGYTYTCYDYQDLGYLDTNPATTGASATAFGKTFPGGVGGPASVTTFNNVALTPGTASFPIVVPAGGSITITYYG